MALGKRLKSILEEKGITILELSQITGISKNTLYAITKRDNDTMRYENLKKIADALNMTPDEIVNYDASKSLEENLSHGTYYVSKEGSVSPMPTEIGHSNLQTFAAHFDGDEYTDEELKEIRRFAEYIKGLRQIERNNLDKSGNN